MNRERELSDVEELDVLDLLANDTSADSISCNPESTLLLTAELLSDCPELCLQGRQQSLMSRLRVCLRAVTLQKRCRTSEMPSSAGRTLMFLFLGRIPYRPSCISYQMDRL